MTYKESLTWAYYVRLERMQKKVDLHPQTIQEWLAKGGDRILKLWVGNFQGKGCRRRGAQGDRKGGDTALERVGGPCSSRGI